MSIFEPIITRLKDDFFTETKSEIRFIYVGFNCKIKKWGKKMMDISSSRGGRGGPTLNGKFIENFHFFLILP